MIEPFLVSLAYNYKIEKKICRKCYATNSIKSKKCRKRKCGHYSDLRLKKRRK